MYYEFQSNGRPLTEDKYEIYREMNNYEMPLSFLSSAPL